MATKARKAELIAELKGIFDNARVAIVGDLSGFTVAEITDFRHKLAEKKSGCRIAKNTLLRIAAKDSRFESIKELSSGPSAVIVGYEDPASTAKVTVEYIKAVSKGQLRGGILEGKIIGCHDVETLAKLPSKEVLLASIMGSMDSGACGIAGMLGAVIRDVALLIDEVARKKNAA